MMDQNDQNDRFDRFDRFEPDFSRFESASTAVSVPHAQADVSRHVRCVQACVWAKASRCAEHRSS